jgi:hypothetical protein
VRALHTLEKGHCQPPGAQLEHERDPGPKRKEEEGERECCSSTAGQAPGQGTAERASGKRRLSPCLEQLQHAAATRGVSPLSQLRRCVGGAARCCVQDSTSFDGGGSRSMVPAQPHHVPLPSHAMTLTVNESIACSVVGAQVVPAWRAAGVRLIGPFLQVVSIVWQLAAATRQCPGSHPSLQPST